MPQTGQPPAARGLRLSTPNGVPQHFCLTPRKPELLQAPMEFDGMDE
jgi:hypothetical protein